MMPAQAALAGFSKDGMERWPSCTMDTLGSGNPDILIFTVDCGLLQQKTSEESNW